METYSDEIMKHIMVGVEKELQKVLAPKKRERGEIERERSGQNMGGLRESFDFDISDQKRARIIPSRMPENNHFEPRNYPVRESKDELQPIYKILEYSVGDLRVQLRKLIGYDKGFVDSVRELRRLYYENDFRVVNIRKAFCLELTKVYNMIIDLINTFIKNHEIQKTDDPIKKTSLLFEHLKISAQKNKFMGHKYNIENDQYAQHTNLRNIENLVAGLRNIIDEFWIIQATPNRCLVHMTDPMYKPTYKTSLCTHWMTTGGCHNGDHCSYAHGPNDIRK